MSFKDVRFWLVAVLSGLLMALSSAPFDQWYLAFVAIVPLFLVTQNAAVHKQGLAYALACTVIATNWWHSSIIFSSLFFILIVFILALSFYFWAVFCSLFRKETSHPFATLFMPAVTWVGIERILSSEFVGIPCNIGITQANQTTFIQSADLFGIYTTSFLIILSNSALAMLAGLLINRFAIKSSFQIKNSLVAIASVIIIFALNIGYGINQIDSQDKMASPVKVAMIQPVISSNLYANSWRNPESREFVRDTLSSLTQAALKEKPDILVWPEGGNGYLNMRIDKLRNHLYQIARDHNTDLLISTNDLDAQGKKYNSIFSISREGKYLDRYNKVMLIPGAEDSYSAGRDFHIINSSFGKIGPSICYESNFPSPLRKLTGQGAELLFVSTSDAPFKKTSLTINHTRTAIFRAIENNRWVIHASNTGPSVIVSPAGEVKASAAFYNRGFVSGEVGYIKEKSLFTLYGYLVPILFSAIVLVLLAIKLKDNIRQRQQGKKVFETKAQDVKLWVKIKRVTPLMLAHGLFLVFLVLTSLLVVFRMAPDTPSGTLAEATKDFLEPLHKKAPDKVAEKFLQAGSNTCGPAALAYLFSFYGHEVLEKELLPTMMVTDKGSTMLELKNTVIKNGFQAKGVRENYAALMKESLPVIAYINDSHYVVVNKITASSIYLFDPLLGHVQVSRNMFEQVWKGYILLVNMKPINERLQPLDLAEALSK